MGQRAVCLFAGTILFLMGGAGLLYIYSFASMVPPDLNAWSFGLEVLRRMYDLSDAGVYSCIATILVLVGIGLVIWSILGRESEDR